MTGKTIRGKTALRQFKKDFEVAFPRRIQLAFLLQDLEDGYNVGSIFRTADCVGALEVVGSGRTPLPPHPMIGVTSLGAHRRVPFRHLGKNEEAAVALVAEGYALVAIEVAEGAEHFMAYDFPEKTCLLLGNEGAGVYGNVLKHCAASVYIPMYGKGRSLNVSHAATVVAFEAMMRGTEG